MSLTSEVRGDESGARRTLKHRSRWIVCALLVNAASSGIGRAEPCLLQTLGLSYPPAPFRQSIALTRDRLIAVTGSEAIVYRRQGIAWVQEASLTRASVPTSSGFFAASVDADGDLLIVGHGQNREAYVFRKFLGSWRHEATLARPTDASEFGASVYISADTALVTGYRGGKVGFVFRRHGSSWLYEAIVQVPAGWALALSDDGHLIAVASAETDAEGEQRWVVRLFERTSQGWEQTSTLVPHDAAPADGFGYAMDIRENRMVIAARWGSDGPAAYVFAKGVTGWIEEAKLPALGGDLHAVAIDGDTIALGEYTWQSAPGNIVEIFRYGPSGWVRTDSVTQPGSNPTFGIDVHSGLLAFRADTEPSLTVWGVSGDCDADGEIDTCQLAAGGGFDCSGNLIPDHCEPDCNANGSPDSCDVVDGLSSDCNANEMPDECESTDDTDGDGTPDCDDQCPFDPVKTSPGQCGCGTSDADTDGDDTADCLDRCRDDPGKIEPLVCGCGAPDEDPEGDGVPECAAGILMVPVFATGLHAIVGHEIILPVGGQVVDVAVQASHWSRGGHRLRAWQIDCDAEFHGTGTTGRVSILDQPRPCLVAGDCADLVRSCLAGYCDLEYGHAAGVVLDYRRPDYVFFGLGTLGVVDLNDPQEVRAAGLVIWEEDSPLYTPPPKHLVLLRLDVSSDATGTFTVDVRRDPFVFPDTVLLRAEDDQPIVPLAAVPARITIRPPICGNDVCELGEDDALCPADCVVDICGDGVCGPAEDEASCRADCSVAVCGNGTCEPPDEDESSCPTDCADDTPPQVVPAISTWGAVVFILLLSVAERVAFRREVVPRPPS